MDDEHLSTPRNDLQMRHYESIVERDHRLQMIRNCWMDDLKEMVILDKRVAYGNEIVKSHPMAIYLNKPALRSMQSTKMNKNLIYERMASFSTSNKIGNDSRYSRLQKHKDLLATMDVFVKLNLVNDGTNCTIAILRPRLFMNYYRLRYSPKSLNFEMFNLWRDQYNTWIWTVSIGSINLFLEFWFIVEFR